MQINNYNFTSLAVLELNIFWISQWQSAYHHKALYTWKSEVYFSAFINRSVP